MAKKKQELTVEEKLAAALVKPEDWPYQVPGNWVWTRLGSVCSKVQYGYTAKSTQDEIGPKLLRITDIQDSFVNWESVPNCEISSSDFEKFSLDKDDIVVARTGATTGKSFLITENVEAVFASYLIRVNLNINFNVKYLYTFMQSNLYWSQIMDLAQGIAQPGVNATKLQNMSFPLPPLAEQQRIVDRIESLFDQLDQAKALIQEALDSFATRKAAILHQAFTGALTKKWREEHIIQKHLEYKKLIDITTKITDGFHNSPSPQNIGYPYVMAGNVKETGINFNSGLFMDEKNHRELYNKAHPKKGDILLVNIGAGSGTSAVIDVDFEFSFKNSAILKLKEDVNPYYVNYYLQYTKEKTLAEISKGGAQPFLSLKVIKEMKIMMLPFVEQNQVVCILDDLFAKEQAAKDLCDQIDQIDTIKKTILGKAFRGELGTNVAGEESAVELLAAFLTG